MTTRFWAAMIGSAAAVMAGLAAFAVLPASPSEMQGSPGHLSCSLRKLPWSESRGPTHWKVRKEDGRLPAPPHDASGHTWHHSNDALFRITKEGLAAVVPGYETDMPAFGETRTDEEILAVLDFIKSRWPQRERQFQQSR